MTVFSHTSTEVNAPKAETGTSAILYGSDDGFFAFCDEDLEISGSDRECLGNEVWRLGVWYSEMIRDGFGCLVPGRQSN